MVCIFVGIFLMIKLEFSYKKIFSQNIKVCLALLMILDIVLEQVLVRLVMTEALLVSPILGTFVITEFIMTMGAEDLKSFIISFFISEAITTFSRLVLGPAIEKLELLTQRAVIALSLRFEFFRDMF